MTEVLRRALRLLIVFIAMWVGVTGTTSVNALFAAPGTDRADAATTLARHVYDIGLQHARAPRLSAINSTQAAFEVLNGPISTGVATFSAAAFSAAEETGPALTRVGRWMGPAEHDAMAATNTVQEGAGGVTSVAHPADPEAFMRQASSGSRYVEFDVPSEALSPGGKAGWASIRGPNSWWANYGRALPEMPSAFNIEWLASRL